MRFDDCCAPRLLICSSSSSAPSAFLINHDLQSQSFVARSLCAFLREKKRKGNARQMIEIADRDLLETQRAQRKMRSRSEDGARNNHRISFLRIPSASSAPSALK